MLEVIYNYEDKKSSRYPCLSIDWITQFEMEYLRKKYSNYENAIDELSEVNLGGNSDDWFNAQTEVQDEFSDLDSTDSADNLDDLFGDESLSDLFEENKEDVSLDELMSIVEEDDIENEIADNKSVFNGDKIPLFVGDEKIMEAKLNSDLIIDLNHFFKRKWELQMSEDESIVIDNKFIIENVLRL